MSRARKLNQNLAGMEQREAATSASAALDERDPSRRTPFDLRWSTLRLSLLWRASHGEAARTPITERVSFCRAGCSLTHNKQRRV